MADKKITVRIGAKDTASRVLRRVQSTVRRLSIAMVGAATAAAAFAKKIINVGAETETARIRLDSIFGSVEAGAKAFDAVRSAAAQLPFTFSDTLEAASMMGVAVRETGRDLETTLKQLAEIGARFGIPIREAASQFQRLALSGAASADMFRERGVTAFLGIKAGAKTTAEESLRAWDEAFERIAEEGSSAVDRLADTWQGQISMLQDALRELAQALSDTGLLDFAKNVVTELTRTINENREAIVQWTLAIASMAKDTAVLLFLANITAAVVRFTIALGAATAAAAFWTGGLVWAGALAGVAAFAELRNRAQEAAIAMREASLEADKQAAFSMNIPTSREGRLEMRNATSRALEAAQRQFAKIPEDLRNILPSARDLGDEIVALSTRLLYLNRLLREGVREVERGQLAVTPPGTEIDPLSGSLGTGFGALLADQVRGAFDVDLDGMEVEEHARLYRVHLARVMDEAWADLDKSIQMEKYFEDMGKTVGLIGMEVGEGLIAGIISGTLDMKEILKRALIGFASLYILGPLKIALGIFSPSRVTYGFGQNLVQGMVLGMDSMSGPLTAATNRMAGTVTSGLALPRVGGLSGVVGTAPKLTATINTDDTSAHPPWALDWLARGNIELRYAGESI